MFYDLNCRHIDIATFVKTYELQYFLGSNSKIPRNKTSTYVESKIDEILQNGLSASDLPLIIAWKIGAINHKESTNRIVYLQNFDNTLEYNTRYSLLNVCQMVENIKGMFSYLKVLAQSDPHKLYEVLFQNRSPNFGTTYIFTLLFFFTKGLCPIYDKYADIALMASKNDIAPFNILLYKSINSSNVNSAWKRYTVYCQALLEIFGKEKYKDRNIDRALWVYGHYFNSNK